MTEPSEATEGFPQGGDGSRVAYVHPPSHDFVVWLVFAEMRRRKLGAPAPLRVRLATTGNVQGAAYERAIVENVMRPAIAMIGAVEDPSMELKDCAQYCYLTRWVVEAARRGEAVPRFEPPAWAIAEVDAFLARGQSPIVITLREAGWQPERNSDLAAWTRFADSVDRSVIFVRDTAFADVPILNHRTCPRASKSVPVRAALYRRAHVNMMVGNGPTVWCMFSDDPYLFFKQLVDIPGWEHGYPRGWVFHDRMTVGENYPWANSKQIVTWKPDTFEEIDAAYREFEKL